MQYCAGEHNIYKPYQFIHMLGYLDVCISSRQWRCSMQIWLASSTFELLQLRALLLFTQICSTHVNVHAGDMTTIRTMQHISCRHPNKHQRPCVLSKLQACQLSHIHAPSCHLRPHRPLEHHLPSSRCSWNVCHSAAAAATFSKTWAQTFCVSAPPDMGPLYSDHGQLQGNAVAGVAFEGAVSALCAMPSGCKCFTARAAVNCRLSC